VNNRVLLEEIVKRQSKTFQPVLFPLQRAFVDDASKFKALICGRRSGKSTTAASYLVEVAFQNPSSRVLYIGLTRSSAKNILWKELKRLNSAHKLGIKFNSTSLIAELPNGSEIILIGANDEAAAEGIRGIKLRLAVIDEAASFRRHLEYLIEEILLPTLLDDDGTLCLVGTPNASCSGPFFDATQPNSPFSIHKWTVLNNPFIKHAATWLEGYKAKKGWDDSNPVYQREWLGRWIKSTDSMVFKYDQHRNACKALPSGELNYLLGIDVGYKDASAFIVGAYRENDPTFYVVHSFKKAHMTNDEIMQKAKELIETYKPVKTVMDSGGGGKGIAETFKKRYSLPIYAAQKTDKVTFIEQMNSDFLSGRIQVMPGNEALTDEWETVQWDENRKLEDKRYLNDAADAALYCFRESQHYTQSAPEPKASQGSDTYWHTEAKRMEEQALEQHQTQMNDAWFNDEI